MSVATDVDWFSVETDEILVELTKQDFQISLSAIDALERRAERMLATETLRAARTSCADLRLDAAICTRQSYEECERRYVDLLNSGVDAELQLLKATILARAATGEARAQGHLLDALGRAQAENVSIELQTVAQSLLSTDG
jgi:hypothetical protein